MKRKSVLYLEIADQIKEDIFSGKYPVGSLLPTETELEALFNVSKITVRNAIELLASDEYVEKKSGRGTTVLSNRPYNKLSKAGSFTQILSKTGLDVTKENLSFEEVTLTPEHAAYDCFGEKAMLFRRVYTLDHQPYIYFEYYLPSELKDVTLELFEQESLYRILDQRGYTIERFEDGFKAATLTLDQQKFLDTTETNGLLRTRRAISPRGKIIEYSEALYNTALYPYLIEYEA
ncbi:GntR family transcriptional regulator [Enterococcus sp. JM4C]|uniref:GntR family transcriptional regulator n=1 Tax=Candidatus Enterococcus huntleyi TaxID=1857217 RepID=UPI001379D114|nr:GntR family transcriptional regulator [Enterococcus sp. JM4C]KAF1295629.1 GntR family transcriptional regulator [Enterococcus sp. JM4C]